MKQLLTAIIAVLATHSAIAGVKIENWVAPGGARVFFVESRVLPMLDVQVDFAAGAPPSPRGYLATRAGIAGRDLVFGRPSGPIGYGPGHSSPSSFNAA